jgi:lipid II isoglutaminyl synthase (glutamine-hydrolysing)
MPPTPHAEPVSRGRPFADAAACCRPQRSTRTGLALTAGRLAARLSRAARLGAGGVIGGRVALALQPDVLATLARPQTTVLVTGTNGKTTTTAMVARAVAEIGPVVSNTSGANMPDGLVAALAEQPSAPYGVLEVDEGHLPEVLARTAPAVMVLLNLSRDQLDRVGEVRRTERALREALSAHPSVTVVANCDDVLVTSVAMAARHPVWVAAGAAWQADSATCPRCGDAVHDRTGQWWCRCGFARPRSDWTLERHGVRTADGRRVPLSVGLPGRANLGNAAMAAAAAVTLGVPLLPALYRIGSISDIAGRYRQVDHQGRRARLLLAKNPAGWWEALAMVAERDRPAVLAINAREADGRDPSWLWDVPFDLLAGRQVIVGGERGLDLAVRLTYAGVAHTVVADPLAAITEVPPGPVDVIGNYTAFHDLARRLGHDR